MAGLVLSVWVCAGCAATTLAQSREGPSRAEFLAAVDAALAQRDAARLSALADLDRWRKSGHPDLDPGALWLPPAPLTRKRDLTPAEVIYDDGEGRSWRLRLRRDEDRNAWHVILPDRPCPSKSMPRINLSDPPRGADAPASSSAVWTVLECWPLPR
jgi:hypothetical protein